MMNHTHEKGTGTSHIGGGAGSDFSPGLTGASGNRNPSFGDGGGFIHNDIGWSGN